MHKINFKKEENFLISLEIQNTQDKKSLHLFKTWKRFMVVIREEKKIAKLITRTKESPSQFMATGVPH